MVSTYYMNVIQGNLFATQTTPALPTIYYLGLSSTLPTVAGANITEPSAGAGYARIPITGLSTPTAGLVTNTTALSFAESTASWGVIPYYVIYGNTTSTNLLMFGSLTASKTVDSQTILTIKTGGLDLQLSN